MELKGKVIDILPVESGTGRNGEWKKQSYIIETQDQYPKKVCAEVWGDKIDTFNIQKEEELTAKINVESREYNGRWYTNVKIWGVDRNTSGSTSAAPASNAASDNYQNQAASSATPPNDVPPPSEEDELPF